MQNAGLDEAQAESGFQEKYQQPQTGRWHHPLAESEEELKSFLMKMKEENEKTGLKLNIQKN